MGYREPVRTTTTGDRVRVRGVTASLNDAGKNELSLNRCKTTRLGRGGDEDRAPAFDPRGAEHDLQRLDESWNLAVKYSSICVNRIASAQRAGKDGSNNPGPFV